MQEKGFETMDFTDEQNEIQINPDDIAGYIIRRSNTSRLHFDIFGVNSKSELLFCIASAVDFDKATSWVDALNKEYYPEVPTPTESVSVGGGGTMMFTPMPFTGNSSVFYDVKIN